MQQTVRQKILKFMQLSEIIDNTFEQINPRL